MGLLKDVEVQIKFGRNPFKFKAIKADVATTIIGWDFSRHHKLIFIWNKLGDILITDREWGIKNVKEFKPMS